MSWVSNAGPRASTAMGLGGTGTPQTCKGPNWGHGLAVSGAGREAEEFPCSARAFTHKKSSSLAKHHCRS